MTSLVQKDQAVLSSIRSNNADNFMHMLRAIAAAISCAGTATLQARQLLITQTAAPFGEGALTQATSGLATAYSLGSVVEFFLSPSFGRFSDRFGRKPVMLFLMIGPALMRTLCAMVKDPYFRIRLLWLDFASARAIGIQPFMGMCGTMISDVYTADDQPAARSQLAAAQATGVVQAVGAVGRMAAPQLFTRLWLRAVAQKGQVGALPLGAPMLSVSAIALLQAWAQKTWSNWTNGKFI
eukprot:Skav224925  [mRNA]  locus=scaffold2105:37197:41115:+ [translate_table: standard]